MKPADRKKQLIAQGRVYRAEVLLAKQATHAALRPESLAKNILNQVAVAAVSAFRNKGAVSSGLSGATWVPTLINGMSALGKRKALLKPILRGALIGSAVAGVIALIAKKKQPSPDQR